MSQLVQFARLQGKYLLKKSQLPFSYNIKSSNVLASYARFANQCLHHRTAEG